MDQGDMNVVARLRVAYEAKFGRATTLDDKAIAAEWQFGKRQMGWRYLTQEAEDALLIAMKRYS